MQTFIPTTSFRQCAELLDYRRLGKQRVETLQLLNALSGKTRGWSNHPAAKQWRGYESALVWYGLVMCDEWIARGYKDTTYDKIKAFQAEYGDAIDLPPWWGREEIHRSHRSRLVQKDEAFYAPKFEELNMDFNLTEDYVWGT